MEYISKSKQDAIELLNKQAHSILEKHSSQYKANGFKLQVLYVINI